MPSIVLELLKYVFLAVLYIFIARAVRAIYLELRPPEARNRRTPAAAPAPARAPASRGKAPRRAVIVEGDSIKGKTFELGDELMIGRGPKCNVILDDNYASQVHARIFSKGDGYMLEDLGSTNGTYLNRQRVAQPVELHRGDRVKIGKVVMEMRK